jgi:hypothetical protein
VVAVLDRHAGARYKRRVPFLAFIESPDSSGDGREEPRTPWILTAAGWLLPWPALIVWLLAASRFADGWVAVGFAYAAIVVAAWRGLKWLPADGLKQSRQ